MFFIHSDKNQQRVSESSPKHSRLRSRIGAVGMIALIVALVGAILFQAYLTHVLSDIKASANYDTVTQYESERVAIGSLVKEAVLQYYECKRINVNSLNDTTLTVSNLLTSYLTAMNRTNLTYAVGVLPTLPSNATSTFWTELLDSDADGFVMNAGDSTTLDAGFKLYSEALPDIVSKNRIAQYIPDTADALAVLTTAGGEVYTFTVVRTDSTTGTSVTFTYYVRMFQVPVTDWNVVAYSIADKADDIVDTPPTLSADEVTLIKAGSVNALCLSKMDAGNDIERSSSTALSNSYPYIYRDLFSAANEVWEWAFYSSDYIGQYFPTASGNGVYLVNLSATPTSEDVTVDGTSYADCNSVTQYATYASSTVTPISYTSRGFTPLYYYNGKSVTKSGYPVTVTTTAGTSSKTYKMTLVTALGGSTALVDKNSDGYITDADASAAGLTSYTPTKVSWTIDLNVVALAGSAAERRIYIKIPDTGTPASTITITDSYAGYGVTSPVVICIEGWKRYNNIKSGAITTVPENYTLYLGDTTNTLTVENLTDQQILIYAVAANVTPGPSNGVKMNGAIMLDDRLSGLDAAYPLTVNGLFGWSGGDDSSSTASPGAKVALTNLTVNAFPSGTNNYFRALAPRYLLVNVQSTTTINN